MNTTDDPFPIGEPEDKAAITRRTECGNFILHVTYLASMWMTYKDLLRSESETRVLHEQLEHTLPTMLLRSLLGTTIVKLIALTEPKAKKDRLTTWQVMKHVDDPHTRDSLQKLQCSIDQRRKPIETLRHTVLAHLNAEVAHGRRQLPSFTNDDVDQSINDLVQFASYLRPLVAFPFDAPRAEAEPLHRAMRCMIACKNIATKLPVAEDRTTVLQLRDYAASMLS
ncbi:MAG TPA: hypothetical protein VK176_03955 [Phycisphaerales bacterium]|nr:hypothetical protein [Phycisphaerales bacterium]